MLPHRHQLPEAYEAPLAYQVQYPWGSLGATDQGSEALGIWPAESGPKTSLTFANQVTSAPNDDVSFDVLVASADEFEDYSFNPSSPEDLMPLMATRGRRGIALVLSLAQTALDPDRNDPLVHFSLEIDGFHKAQMLGNTVSYVVKNNYVDVKTTQHKSRMMQKIQTLGLGWLAFNAIEAQVESDALGLPPSVVPIATFFAVGVPAYRMISRDYDARPLREENWSHDAFELARRVHSDILHTFGHTNV